MKTLKITMTLIALTLSTHAIASLDENTYKFDVMEKEPVRLIVKFKDQSIHNAFLLNPQKELMLKKEAEIKNTSVSNLKERYNLSNSGNYSQGFEKLEVLSNKNNLKFSHLNSLALNSDVITVEGSDVDAETLAKKLMKTGDFQYVYVDRIVKKQFNDPLYPKQVHFLKNKVLNLSGQDYEGMREMTVNNLGRKIRVGVVDSGYAAHEDIDPLNEGYDFLVDENSSYLNPETMDDDPTDETELVDGSFCHDGHGLSVAGLIGAKSNNGLGVAGVVNSEDLELVYARVLNCKGSGRSSGTLNAVAWLSGYDVPNVPSISEPVDIINLSLGGKSITGCNDYEQGIYTNAMNNGVVVVVSAGNDKTDAAMYAPASCDDVITVGATSSQGDLSQYSNYGEHVDVLAEGTNVDMLSTTKYGEESLYFVGSGTSMSSPNIAGGVANLILTYGKQKPYKIKEILKSNGYDYSKDYLCSTLGCGAGLVNMLDVMKSFSTLPNIEKHTKKHRYEGYESAEQLTWLASMDKYTDVCNSVKYTWGGLGAKHEGITYKLYKEDQEGTMIYDETVEFSQKIYTLDESAVVGVQACDLYGCGNIKRMIGKIKKPSYCEV